MQFQVTYVEDETQAMDFSAEEEAEATGHEMDEREDVEEGEGRGTRARIRTFRKCLAMQTSTPCAAM